MKTDILIINNQEGRNGKFLPLFNSLIQRNVGKLMENWYYCVSTDVFVNVQSEEGILFTALQRHSYNRGIKYNLYIIKEENV